MAHNSSKTSRSTMAHNLNSFPSSTYLIRFAPDENQTLARGRDQSNNLQSLPLQALTTNSYDLDKSEPKYNKLSKTGTNDSTQSKSTSSRSSSLAALADRLRPRSRSCSHSRSRSQSLNRTMSFAASLETEGGGYSRIIDRGHASTSASSSPPSPPSSPSSSSGDHHQRDTSIFRYSSWRKPTTEYVGTYAEVARAQNLFMERLREEQERKHIIHNVDGLPLPSPPIRRQANFSHILGIDKPLLLR